MRKHPDKLGLRSKIYKIIWQDNLPAADEDAGLTGGGWGIIMGIK